MDLRGVAPRALIPWLLVIGFGLAGSVAEKLSPDQKAPPFARGSGGLILKAPFESDQGARGRPISNAVDDVQREETEMLKIVDGQPVRTVEGSFSYKSPEGLPIFVKYMADENGNKASFKFGSAVSGGTGSGPPGGQKNRDGPGRGSKGSGGGGGGGGGGGRGGGGGGGGGGSTYLPPKDVDRSYLPPQ